MSNKTTRQELLDERAANNEEIRQINNRIKMITNLERDAKRRERTHRLIDPKGFTKGTFQEFKAFLLHLIDEEVPL